MPGKGGPRVAGGGNPIVLVSMNVAVLLAVIVAIRLRRRTHARSRNDEKLTVAIVLVLGLLLAPTEIGQQIVHIVGQLADSLAHARI